MFEALSSFIGFDVTGTGSNSIVAQSTSQRRSDPAYPHRADLSAFGSSVQLSSQFDDHERAINASGGEDPEALWNLGESSFPLLPHDPHEFEDPFAAESDEDEGSSSPKVNAARILAMTRSSQHFSSILNNPFDHESWNEEVLPDVPATAPYIEALSDSRVNPMSIVAQLESMEDAVDTFREYHSDFDMRKSSRSPVSQSPTTITRSIMSQSTTNSLAESPDQLRLELDTCLQSIPAGFLADDFDLLKEETFVKHVESVRLAKSSSAQRANSQESTALQTQLSVHLDNVEVSLFKQINARSHLFFGALDTLHVLKDECKESVSQIQSLRRNCALVDRNLAGSVLSSIQQHQRHHNLTGIVRKLELMSAMGSTTQTIQLLLSTGDYSSALELCSSTRNLLETELAGINCMKSIDRKVLEQMKLIEKLMVQELSEIVVCSEYEKGEFDDEERDRVSPLVENLLRLGTFSQAINQIKPQVLAAIERMLSKIIEDQLQHSLSHSNSQELDHAPTVPASSPEPNLAAPLPTSRSTSPLPSAVTAEPVQPNHQSAADSLNSRLQQLSHDGFISFLSLVFTTLMNPINRLASLKTIESVQSSMIADSLSVSSSTPSIMEEFLSSVCESVHTRVSKLLAARSTIHASLSLLQFRQLLDQVLGFLHSSESLCKKQFYGLRGALLQQAKAFVGNFHRSCITQLNTALESEKWVRVDVQSQYQSIIDQQFIRRSSQEPLAETTERKVLFVPINRSSNQTNNQTSTSNFLKFPAVHSLLVFLSLVEDYVDLSSQLPALTLDSLHRLLELLTLFNSRVCQLVLGAGAMHLAGLKSITATHLALAFQCIALLSLELPVLKQIYMSRLAAKHHSFLQSFDRIQNDCNEHTKQIKEKLTSIMQDLCEQMSRKMIEEVSQTPDQSSDVATGDEAVCPSIRTLMKQTGSLHRALTDLLAVNNRDDIFSAIGSSLSTSIVSAADVVVAQAAEREGDANGIKTRLQANLVFVYMRVRVLAGIQPCHLASIQQCAERLGVVNGAT